MKLPFGDTTNIDKKKGKREGEITQVEFKGEKLMIKWVKELCTKKNAKQSLIFKKGNINKILVLKVTNRDTLNG